MYRYLIFLALISVHALAFQNVSQPGTLEGVVLDEHGKPVSGVTVLCHLYVPGMNKRGVVPSALTGPDGHFSVTHLVLGEYIVSASKKEDGYPDHTRGLHADGSAPRFTLDAENPVVTNVVIVLGQKAAILAGSISDAFTGAPVAAHLEVSRSDGRASHSESVKGTYLVLLPPDIPIDFSVKAAGYADWYYPAGSDVTASSPLTLDSGDHKTLNIQLVPKSK